MNKEQKKYLEDYLESLNPEQRTKPGKVTAGYFCDDEENANICADLILRGEKTATCSMKYWYESGLEDMPESGDLHIVTDWKGNPISIIEVTDVSECKFSEVTEDFAASEGEGDKSLKWWRKAHWDFFSRECRQQGLEADEQMTLILETFKVVYPQGTNSKRGGKHQSAD